MRTCATCGAVWDDAFDLCSFDGGALRTVFDGPRVIGDRYLLEQRIASGAMGVVFRATHLQLGSTVAVKLMQPMREGLVVGLLRFHREGQILGQIKHPNAVLVIDFGVEERNGESLPYLVTEYLRGEGLDVKIAREGALSLEDVARLIVPLCEAVHEAHEVGVIHRDIKPSNVFLERLRDNSTIVKVLDFGIAKFIEVEPEILARKRRENATWALRYGANKTDFFDEIADIRRVQGEDDAPSTKVARRGKTTPTSHMHDDTAAARPQTVTEAGFMVGTILYMAPEQMTGEALCRQTDLYAIATLAFQLLTGALPFEGDDDDVITQKLSAPAPSARECGAPIDHALDDVLRRALAIEPFERGHSVLELAAAFRSALPEPAQDHDDDPALSLSIQVGALVRVVHDIDDAVRSLNALPSTASATSSGDYAAARDRLLAIPGPLSRTAQRCSALKGTLDHDAQMRLTAAATELEDAAIALSRELSHLDRGLDATDFLLALWYRVQLQIDRTVRDLDRLSGRRRAPSPVALPALAPPRNPFADAPPQAPRLRPLFEQLAHADDLDAADAFDRLVDEHGDAVRLLLQPSSGATTTAQDDEDIALALRGYWRHCDRLLVRELYDPQPPRLLPLLATLEKPFADGFRSLGAFFGEVDARAEDAEQVRAEFLALASARRREGEDDDTLAHEAEIFDRCLLLHPADAVRDAAMERLPLSAVWTLLLAERLPLGIARLAFTRAMTSASDEYLKVFFLCVKESVQSAPDDQLPDAFGLMRLFFAVDCFHEDIVFEPLVELDHALRIRVRARPTLGDEHMVDSAYDDASAAFAAKGMRDSKMESFKEVPLAVQRKLAREGHFIERFMSHPLDKVALETLPHLMRREDVARFLRVPTIHRAVIVELAKVRRLFRKDQARLALLQNPKTPANVARIYLPLLPHVQVQNLSRNKHIGAEVRALAQAFAEKLALQTEQD